MGKKKDYYEVLGVARSASAEQVKSAYRKLARELHPDVNKAADAASRFSAVQEAYDVLSEPEKRRVYDQFGHAGVGAGASADGGGDPRRGGTYTWSNVGGRPGGFDVSQEDIGSIFEEVFGMGGGGGGGGFGGGSPFGAKGGRAGGRSRGRAARPARGEDVTHTLDVDFMTALRGGSESLRLTTGSKSQTIDVRIPRGVRSGTKLRLRGKGQPGAASGEAGDLILEIRVGDHPVFRREGMDLLVDLPLTIVEATLGATVSIPTVESSATLRVPQGTASGSKLRLRGQGVRAEEGEPGDLYAVIKIVPPRELSENDRKVLEELGTRLPKVREG